MVVLIGQSMSDYYVDISGRVITPEAWSWFLPNVFPTLSLMIGVAVSEFGSEIASEKHIDPFLYRLALWLSVAYFLVLMAELFLQPFFCVDQLPIDFLKKSNLWLGPMQSIVTGALGFFFAKTERKSALVTKP